MATRPVGRTTIAVGLLATALLLSFMTYYPLNRPTPDARVLATPLDGLIPLVPLFAVPYLLHLPVIAGSFIYFLARRMRTFIEAAVGMIACNLVGAGFFLLMQTTIERPSVEVGGLNSLVLLIYANDGPYNLFPSLHVAGATTYAIAHWRARTPFRELIVVFAAIVAASTVLVKQHHVVDVPAGALLAALAYFAAIRLCSRLLGVDASRGDGLGVRQGPRPG